MLDKFIHNEPIACIANNLQDMLQPNWTEGKKSYRIMSELNEKKEKRVKGIINQNRYSSLYDV